MSSSYSIEPQTNAKVLMKTNAGDLEIELWGKECPLAVRNFLQHSLDGYYEGTIFHRIIPNFIIQGGDPTGTGEGGDAIYPGGTFADEINNRLKFNRRGLLGMADMGGKDSNASQFFLTLAETRELTGKNTLFGKVMGDTIYNLVQWGEREVEGEKFVYPVKISKIEVLVNPYDDIVRRVKEQVITTVPKKVEKKKAKKGKAILSFAGDEEGDLESLPPPPKKAKFDKRLVTADVSEATEKPQPNPSKRSPSPPPKRQSSPPPAPKPSKSTTKSDKTKPTTYSRSPTRSPSPVPVDRRTRKLAETESQIAALKSSLKRTRTPTPPPQDRSSKPKSATALFESLLPETTVKGRNAKRHRKGRRIDDDADEEAFQALQRFRQKLESAVTTSKPSDLDAAPAAAPGEGTDAAEDDDEPELCDLHFIPNCQSCKWHDAQSRSASPDGDVVKGGSSWMAHALTFEKDRLGKSLEWKRKNEEELVVIDPREKAAKILEEKRGKGGRGRAFRPDGGRGRR
ncbi:cyclophilin-like protein [Ascobolus immersus RN42]|uniref:Cyclophilin-like protein n=1 Tax=Ascobolus immersus RN42 TaxID=1160509 RepID=A0A3N4HZR3_ASCIM|nr:cyclophilin-like protein [Ascobolus immersus RN42]